MHSMCVEKILNPDFKSFITRYETAFTTLSQMFSINMTLKIHVILHHYEDYFECTGMSLCETNGEYVESAHSTLKNHEKRSSFAIVTKLGTKIHHMKSLQSISSFNSKKAGFTPSREFKLRKSCNISPVVKPTYKYKKSFLNKYYPD